jgi:hypothetical protein
VPKAQDQKPADPNELREIRRQKEEQQRLEEQQRAEERRRPGTDKENNRDCLPPLREEL